MNKILHMNSFFTKIILAVLSFAVIICIFVPYMIIPAVPAVHSVDTENKTLSLNIGKNQLSANLVSEFSNGRPYLIYTDSEKKQTVASTSIPTPDAENNYFIEFYAYGTDVVNDGKKVEYVPIDSYDLILNKESKNNSLTSLSISKSKKSITIDVPNATAFDFTRVIEDRKAWCRFDNKNVGSISERSDVDNEVTSVNLKLGETKSFYISIALKSETNRKGEASAVYYPTTMYTASVYRDDLHSTLPAVGEIGLGIESKKLSDEKGEAILAGSDTYMFIFMIAALISTLCAFVIPAKIGWIQLAVSSLLGAALIVVPILDYTLFFGANGYDFKPGWFILIALGVLILLAGVFNFIRCRSEYREEQIRIYGEDVFKKK